MTSAIKIPLCIVGPLAAIGVASPAFAQPGYLTCNITQGNTRLLSPLGPNFSITVDEEKGTMLIGENFDGGRATFTADMIRLAKGGGDDFGFIYELNRVTLALNVTLHTPRMGTDPPHDDTALAQCAVTKAPVRQI